MRNIPIWIGYEVSYLSAIGALTYLANTKRPIAFSVNMLSRYISTPTRRHQNGIRYMSLFYSKNSNPDLIGHVDVGYSSNPHKSLGLKHAMCLHVGILLYLGDIQSSLS